MKNLILFVATICLISLNSCQKDDVDGASNYPYDIYPQLNGIELLIERKVTGNVEEGFNEHYSVFRDAGNPVQSCVYCYFVDGSDEYQELLNYSSRHYKQVFLLLIRDMFSSSSSTLRYDNERMPSRDPFKSLVFEGLYYKVFPEEYKQLLADNYLFILDENLITRWDLPEYEEAGAIYAETGRNKYEDYKVFFDSLLTDVMEKCKK